MAKKINVFIILLYILLTFVIVFFPIILILLVIVYFINKLYLLIRFRMDLNHYIKMNNIMLKLKKNEN